MNLGHLRCDWIGRPHCVIIFQILPGTQFQLRKMIAVIWVYIGVMNVDFESAWSCRVPDLGVRRMSTRESSQMDSRRARIWKSKSQIQTKIYFKINLELRNQVFDFYVYITAEFLYDSNTIHLHCHLWAKNQNILHL